jgi:Na+-transporting methylmalonyl-CoA/oxaloacetate decarboxylase beta subunit
MAAPVPEIMDITTYVITFLSKELYYTLCYFSYSHMAITPDINHFIVKLFPQK